MITFKSKYGEVQKVVVTPPKRVKLAYKSLTLHKHILQTTTEPMTMAELASQFPDTHPKTLGYHIRRLVKFGKLKMLGSRCHKGEKAATYQTA
jgi:hypothetical protein